MVLTSGTFPPELIPHRNVMWIHSFVFLLVELFERRRIVSEIDYVIKAFRAASVVCGSIVYFSLPMMRFIVPALPPDFLI